MVELAYDIKAKLLTGREIHLIFEGNWDWVPPS